MTMFLDKVVIIPSLALSEMRLEELIGKTGKIVETHARGSWVLFPYEIKGEKEWFIPNSSII